MGLRHPVSDTSIVAVIEEVGVCVVCVCVCVCLRPRVCVCVGVSDMSCHTRSCDTYECE